jgi:hypothetical protein
MMELARVKGLRVEHWIESSVGINGGKIIIHSVLLSPR